MTTMPGNPHAETLDADYIMTPDILTDYQPGDEHGWATEFAYLATRHDSRLRMLRKSIEKRGIRRPLLLGNDGRLWDGHHRLLVAVGLGIEFVPVERANDEHVG